MDTEFGLKELEQVVLKATYPIEINGVCFEEGEVIAAFDRIQIANFQELKKRVSANGGFDNRGWVFWEDTKEIQLSFTQGIFSRNQFALLSNSRIIKIEEEHPVLIHQREVLETENGVIYTRKLPVGNFFVYDKAHNKLQASIQDAEKHEINIVADDYTKVVIDYDFEYINGASNVVLGQRLVPGFLSFEGKTRVKDDITGQTKTGILKIPKLKLMSDLSMRLGQNAIPVVANFQAVGCPVGGKGDKKVMEIIFLEDDIDADIE